MGLFARNAEWLKNYFTPSVSSAAQQPVAVSDDVQLVHPYSSGWGEQHVLDYFFTASLLNPGQGNNLFLVIPPALEDATENDVVWSPALINMRIPGGTAAQFDFISFIGDNGSAGLRIVHFDEGSNIAALATARAIVYPSNNLDSNWPAVITRQGLRTSGIGIQQTSAQAVSTVGLTVEAWILRAPRGGVIGWP